MHKLAHMFLRRLTAIILAKLAIGGRLPRVTVWITACIVMVHTMSFLMDASLIVFVDINTVTIVWEIVIDIHVLLATWNLICNAHILVEVNSVVCCYLSRLLKLHLLLLYFRAGCGRPLVLVKHHTIQVIVVSAFLCGHLQKHVSLPHDVHSLRDRDWLNFPESSPRVLRNSRSLFPTLTRRYHINVFPGLREWCLWEQHHWRG